MDPEYEPNLRLINILASQEKFQPVPTDDAGNATAARQLLDSLYTLTGIDTLDQYENPNFAQQLRE